MLLGGSVPPRTRATRAAKRLFGVFANFFKEVYLGEYRMDVDETLVEHRMNCYLEANTLKFSKN